MEQQSCILNGKWNGTGPCSEKKEVFDLLWFHLDVLEKASHEPIWKSSCRDQEGVEGATISDTVCPFLSI
jgi:hypothetical protein